MGISVSLCMIVKNEENNLENCLKTVYDIVDEINIVDTGSTDRTVEIAKRYTDRIFYFEWINDFSAARNFSFSKATKDYIFWLDADDIITPENRAKLLKLKKIMGRNIKYINMPYHYAHDANGRVTFIGNRERFVKRSEGFKWKHPIHEVIDVSGQSMDVDIFITHNHIESEDHRPSLERNLQILEQHSKNDVVDKQMLTYYVRTLYALGRLDEALEQIRRLMLMPAEEGDNSMHRSFLIAHSIYLLKGDEESAVKVLLEYEDVLNNDSEYHCALGDFYFIRRNDVNKALICFLKALECDGKAPNGNLVERKEEFYYFKPLQSIVNCYIELQQYDKALHFCEKALKYNPTDEAMLTLFQKLARLNELLKTT